MPGTTRRQLALAVSLRGVGSHPAADRVEDPSAAASWRRWAGLIAEADRGGLDLVTLADGPTESPELATDRHRNGRRAWASAGAGAARLPWLDPTLIACRVAPLSDTIGLVPEVPTT